MTLVPLVAFEPRARAATREFPEQLATTSQSGQFLVAGPRVPGTSPPRDFRPGDEPRQLTPQTLTVACERIKAEVLRVLQMPDQWRAGGGHTGKIVVVIEPDQNAQAPVTVEAIPFETGWQFRLAVPSSLTEERLVRAVVQAVTMEIANRAGNQRAAEPPLWLTEGLTQSCLRESVEGSVPTPQTRSVLEVRRHEALARARELLSTRAPLSFHEISQPDLSRLSDREWEQFAVCAHLCLHEIRRLPEGTVRLRRWVMDSQQYWNWQTGFVEAFHPVFRSLLDVEKWWAVTVASFSGRDAIQAWSPEFTLRKLDEALQPVGVLPGAGSQARRVGLEEVLNAWDFARQLPVLHQLARQLKALQVNAPQTLRPLVTQYLDWTDDYLTARGRPGSGMGVRGQPIPTAKSVTREAVARLRELDGERARLASGVSRDADVPPPAAGTPAATSARR